MELGQGLRIRVLVVTERSQVMVTSVLWGIGTAIGEIPPYWLSYSAAVAGQKNEMLLELEVRMPYIPLGTWAMCRGWDGRV